jgi:hydrogenase nickel incorporation protein HypA/HybF
MHEMGIASSILEAVRQEQLRYPGYRAAKVGVRIGQFAGVDGESLRFCFEAIVKGSPFAALELAVEAGTGDELDLSAVEFEDAEFEDTEVCA